MKHHDTVAQFFAARPERLEKLRARAGTQVEGEKLPDQSEVNTDEIPYGKTVMTKQGHVCSTAPSTATEAQLQTRRTI